MASESFKALMLVATLRSKGGVFSDGGPEILDQLEGSSERPLSVDSVN